MPFFPEEIPVCGSYDDFVLHYSAASMYFKCEAVPCLSGIIRLDYVVAIFILRTEVVWCYGNMNIVT